MEVRSGQEHLSFNRPPPPHPTEDVLPQAGLSPEGLLCALGPQLLQLRTWFSAFSSFRGCIRCQLHSGLLSVEFSLRLVCDIVRSSPGTAKAQLLDVCCVA